MQRSGIRNIYKNRLKYLFKLRQKYRYIYGDMAMMVRIGLQSGTLIPPTIGIGILEFTYRNNPNSSYFVINSDNLSGLTILYFAFKILSSFLVVYYI